MCSSLHMYRDIDSAEGSDHNALHDVLSPFMSKKLDLHVALALYVCSVGSRSWSWM